MKRKLILKVKSINADTEGSQIITAEQLFGDYEKMSKDHRHKMVDFLSKVNKSNDFVEVPEELMDYTSAQNFYYYVMNM